MMAQLRAGECAVDGAGEAANARHCGRNRNVAHCDPARRSYRDPPRKTPRRPPGWVVALVERFDIEPFPDFSAK